MSKISSNGPLSLISGPARPVSSRIGRARTVSVSPVSENVPDDDLRRADDLTDANDGRVAQPGDDRHTKQIERVQPFVATHYRQAEREQAVGENDGRCLPEPVAPWLARSGLERHDQHARRRGRCRGLRLRRRSASDAHAIQGCDGARRHRRGAPSTDHAARPLAGLTVTDIAQRVAPVARHSSVTTSASRLKSDISRRRAAA